MSLISRQTAIVTALSAHRRSRRPRAGLGQALAALSLLAAAAGALPVSAQEPPKREIKQIELTDAQVKGFITSQKDLSAISEKIQAAGDNPDEALKAELEGIARKHGFANFAELDDVAANISIVMAGLDPQTGVFNDPLEALKKELADVQADASIPEAEKKQLVEELTEAISTTPPLQHRKNIDVVKAHRDEIEKALQ